MIGTRTEIVISRGATRYAYTVVDIPAGHSQYQVNITRAGNVETYYQVSLVVDPDPPVPGWRTAQIKLSIDNTMGADGQTLPIVWYDGEPTDWPTGVARFPFHSWITTQDAPDEIWCVFFRRCS